MLGELIKWSMPFLYPFKLNDSVWICNKYVMRDLLELVTRSVLALLKPKNGNELETNMVIQLIN